MDRGCIAGAEAPYRRGNGRRGMRLRKLPVAALAALALAGPGPAAAGTLCRPDTLGSVLCPVAPPPPRPIYRRPVQALDRVGAEPPARNPAPAFVPARDVDRL